jgi:hypothetical protein
MISQGCLTDISRISQFDHARYLLGGGDPLVAGPDVGRREEEDRLLQRGRCPMDVISHSICTRTWPTASPPFVGREEEEEEEGE